MTKRLRGLAAMLLVGSFVLIPAQKASASNPLCDRVLMDCLDAGGSQGDCCIQYCMCNGNMWSICWIMCGMP